MNPGSEAERLEVALPEDGAGERTLAEILADARTQPEQYLAETIVPAGGE